MFLIHLRCASITLGLVVGRSDDALSERFERDVWGFDGKGASFHVHAGLRWVSDVNAHELRHLVYSCWKGEREGCKRRGSR